MKIFSGDKAKDMKLIGKLFTLKEANGETNLRVRFVEINFDGYYVFKVTTRNSELEEFSTKRPNHGDIIK